jgi:hypothetical protein
MSTTKTLNCHACLATHATPHANLRLDIAKTWGHSIVCAIVIGLVRLSLGNLEVSPATAELVRLLLFWLMVLAVTWSAAWGVGYLIGWLVR